MSLPFEKSLMLANTGICPSGFRREKWFLQNLITEFNHLLEKHSNSESHFQKFFEKNPCMLPGALSLPIQSGHYPYAGTVISQPILTGLTTKKPDFMWIACDSGTVYPVLIEIEAPSKKYFTKKGNTTAKFNQAQDQLAEWKAWFSHGNNQQLFYDLFQIPSSFSRGKKLIPLYVLVYGRREEIKNDVLLSEKRSHLNRQDEFIMSYDRLAPEYKARYLLCSFVKNGKFIAKHTPPTLEIGPNLADDLNIIINKEEAIKNNKLISYERKQFLINRIPYWDEFGRIEHKGLINSRDKE